MTATTTITVSRETRDLLKVQAEAAHQTLGEYLHDLAAAADRRTRFSRLSDAIRNTPSDLLVSHEAEAAAWEGTELTDPTK
jgi:hypothetical protein